MENIGERIEREYNLFYLDMMRTSRENLFAKSREIEMKKRIAFALKKWAREQADEVTVLRMLAHGNILDSVYRLASEYDMLSEMNASEVIARWSDIYMGVKIYG